nr:MAG TPA: KilAC domain protein [Caudoviricetes sp.]
MQQIIPIGKSDFAGCPKQTVNARELHAFLDSKQDFSTWIKARIAEYDFVEHQDFVLFHNFMEKGRPRIEYFITLDMAKELSMVERTAKGKQARQYFIDCEKRAQAVPQIPQTLSEALRLAADLADEKAALLAEQQRNAPKVAFAEAVANANDTILIRDLAKVLKQNGIDIGEKRLFAWLRANGYLTLQNMPMQRAMDMGLFWVSESVIALPDGDRVRLTTRVTGKGQMYFLDKFKRMEAAV